jgi:hypothetical protein
VGICGCGLGSAETVSGLKRLGGLSLPGEIPVSRKASALAASPVEEKAPTSSSSTATKVTGRELG